MAGEKLEESGNLLTLVVSVGGDVSEVDVVISFYEGFGLAFVVAVSCVLVVMGLSMLYRTIYSC